MGSKHIKVRGEYIPALGAVKLTVISRTHVSYKFGGYHRVNGTDCRDSEFAFTEGSMRIASDGSYIHLSEFRKENLRGTGQTHTLYIPDDITEDSPEEDRTLLVSLEEWKAIKVAVAAYNTFYK